jgi:diguanylate cyclase (GGDEF)-like protein/PAS domain S-box-containing protein
MNQKAVRQADNSVTGKNFVFWLESGKMEVPDVLRQMHCTPTAWTKLASLPEDAVLFAAIDRDAAGSQIRKIRAQISDATYVVAVLDALPTPAWMLRLVELGADDAVTHDSAALQAAGIRALRQVRRLTEVKAELGETALHLDFLQASIDTLPSPIFFKNRQGYYTGFNKAFEDMTGLTAGEALGKSVFELFSEDLADRYYTADEELMSQGGTQIYEGQVRFADGSVRDVCFNKATIEGPGGQVRGLAGAVLDISDRKAYEAILKENAERDYLTQAFNRRKFFELASDAEKLATNGTQPVCVGVFDIDNFKMVNDRFGHAAGDEALRVVASRLMSAFSEPDCVARAGGEEFYVLFNGKTPEEALAKAEQVRIALAGFEVDLGDKTLNITISAGVSALQDEDDALSHAISRADHALYRAKHEGRNKVHAA